MGREHFLRLPSPGSCFFGTFFFFPLQVALGTTPTPLPHNRNGFARRFFFFPTFLSPIPGHSSPSHPPPAAPPRPRNLDTVGNAVLFFSFPFLPRPSSRDRHTPHRRMLALRRPKTRIVLPLFVLPRCQPSPRPGAPIENRSLDPFPPRSRYIGPTKTHPPPLTPVCVLERFFGLEVYFFSLARAPHCRLVA